MEPTSSTFDHTERTLPRSTVSVSLSIQRSVTGAIASELGSYSTNFIAFSDSLV